MWIRQGFSGEGCESLLGELHGHAAIVAGNAKGVFEEVAATESRMGRYLVFGVNDVSVFLPHVDHMVSLHTPKLDCWAELRRDSTSQGYGNKDFRVHDAGKHGERLWHQWTELTPIMALSGLFAAQIAFLMGCEPIVLVGCPTDSSPCFWQPDGTVNAGYEKTQYAFKFMVGQNVEFRKALRSQSGWSKALLGAYTC